MISCNVEKSFGYNISVLVLLIAALITSVTQSANSAMTIEPSTDMVAIPYYYILSINGIDVDHLLLGTTTFGDEPFISHRTPDSCDDFNLRSVADAIYQPWVETNFDVPVETIFIVEAGGADSGYMQPIDANGVAMEEPIPFSPDSFANTGIGSRYGEAAVLAVITLDPMAYGIRILPPDDGYMGIDLLSVSAVPVGGPVPPPPPPSGTLSEALDTTLDFTTSGNADWFFQVTTSYHDGDAAQSGSISHNQESRMQTTVNGPGTLSFWWKVSSHPSWDWLEFYVNGVRQDRISGSQGWHQMTYAISSGSHTLEWRYKKDDYATFGWDCGWVDLLEWTPDGAPSPSGELPEAMDTTLDFNTGGSANWFYQANTSYHDGDAAQSGDISHHQESWMQTTAQGSGTLSFWWKVSSESSWDWLEFYVNSVRQDRISGSQDWNQMTYAIPSGSQILEWRYTKDGSVSSGSDCGWVDKVEWTPGSEPPPPPPPSPPTPFGDLPEALDTTLDFISGGNADWFYQVATSYYDGDAAQSGDISHNQESWMQTTVQGPGTLSFWWKVNSESGYDFLEFYVDGSRQDRISGPVDWQQMTYAIPSSSHTLEWRYAKDGSVNSGDDCGWIDKVEWTPGGAPPPPLPSGDLSDALDTTLDFTTRSNANWFYQTSTFYYDGDAAQSADISDGNYTWMETRVQGPNTVSFWWKVDSESNYDFLEFYIDDLYQDRISGSMDWHQMTYFIPSGLRTLEWRYVKDGSVSLGSDCGWVDKIEWTSGSEPPPPPPPLSSNDLSEALDTTLDFISGGDADWFYQTAIFYNDGDAARSGDISDDEDAWMETTVTGPGTAKFYWKVSSESGYDFLLFYIGDSIQDRISGMVDWQQMMYTIPSGSHILGWGYIKDYSVSSGSDCGWVDWLEWTPDS